MVNFRDPASMSEVIGNVLRYGVVLSGVITVIGLALLASQVGYEGVEGFLTYNPSQVPHGNFDVTLSGLVSGILSLKPFAIIDLGVIVLIGTPVSRVLTSVLLFAAEKDRLYVYITAFVLILLLFSIFVTPLIPIFQA